MFVLVEPDLKPLNETFKKVLELDVTSYRYSLDVLYRNASNDILFYGLAIVCHDDSRNSLVNACSLLSVKLVETPHTNLTLVALTGTLGNWAITIKQVLTHGTSDKLLMKSWNEVYEYFRKRHDYLFTDVVKKQGNQPGIFLLEHMK